MNRANLKYTNNTFTLKNLKDSVSNNCFLYDFLYFLYNFVYIINRSKIPISSGFYSRSRLGFGPSSGLDW